MSSFLLSYIGYYHVTNEQREFSLCEKKLNQEGKGIYLRAGLLTKKKSFMIHHAQGSYFLKYVIFPHFL